MRQSQCPDCHSYNIKFFEARNRYSCNDCGCSFSDEIQKAKKLRIFLSYGHDHNEELVRLIKTDLEKRGHDVWFDKNEIKFGDEWRRSITDGILGSNRVLSFLTRHSTRDPGVCRDEIAIAIGVKGGNIQTILVESEKEVQPPVNIGHIQWLDMHEWQEKKATNEAEWKQWYQAKLAEIVQVVESEETRRFAGEIEKLSEYLKPIKSDARISGLLSKGFYGREWLFEAVEKWRQDSVHDSRLFWIMGDPGVGKSAFAAQLTHKRGDTVIAAQFVEWDKTDHRDARRVVCSIAFQIATRLPDYRKLLLTLPEIKELDRKDASELFDYLLANPLKSAINGGREKLLIVIDALDEAGESGRNPPVEMLARNAHHLPDWLGMVVTSRPEFDVKTPFQALNPLPIDTKSESNKADIRDYLNNKLATQLQNQPNAETLVNQILEKSEGVFLYAERFFEDVHQGHISLDKPDQFPQGLGGIFAQYFQRQFPDLEKFRKEIRPALRAILAAREPLPLEILQKLFHWEDEELRDFTHTLGSLYPVTKTTDSETIKPYHKSLADWMGDETKAGVYFVSVMEGHRMLADYCFNSFNTNIDLMNLYEVRHITYHLNKVGRDKDSKYVFNDELFQLRRLLFGVFYIDESEILHHVNRCFSDAEKGWVGLALERLSDILNEYPDNAQVEYAEALIRKDFLGEGIKAEELFIKAQNHSTQKEKSNENYLFSTFRAVEYARNKEEFQHQFKIAFLLAPEDENISLFNQIFDLISNGVSYSDILSAAVEQYQKSSKHGDCASFAELAINAGNLSVDEELALRVARMMSLRKLDREAETLRNLRGEIFPPSERLALIEAMKELNKILILKPDDHVLLNFRSAWLYLFDKWEEAILSAEKAIKYSPKGYCKPKINMALALSKLGKKNDAMRMAFEVVDEAQEIIERQTAQKIIEDLSLPEISINEKTIILSKRIIDSTRLTSKQNKELENIIKGFERRLIIIGMNWGMQYIKLTFELLQLFTPEDSWLAIDSIKDKGGKIYLNIVYGVLFIATHAKGSLNNDACKCFALVMLSYNTPDKIQEFYRNLTNNPPFDWVQSKSKFEFNLRNALWSINPDLTGLLSNIF